MKITIHKNIATFRTELRVIDYENELFLNDKGEWEKLVIGNAISTALSLPYSTEIETTLFDTEHKSLLKQKHEDKENHIQNLNELLIRAMK